MHFQILCLLQTCRTTKVGTKSNSYSILELTGALFGHPSTTSDCELIACTYHRAKMISYLESPLFVVMVFLKKQVKIG